jgi:hypothetical protein
MEGKPPDTEGSSRGNRQGVVLQLGVGRGATTCYEMFQSASDMDISVFTLLGSFLWCDIFHKCDTF